MRDESEIQKEADIASDACHHASKWPNMTYEQGVSYALDWVLENTDDKPIGAQ